MERVACLWSSIQSEYDHRLCWSCLLNTLITLVEHGLDAAVAGACDDDVANLQRSIRHEHCRDIATTFVER